MDENMQKHVGRVSLLKLLTGGFYLAAALLGILALLAAKDQNK